MNKFCPNLKRLIKCKMHMMGPFKEMAKATKELEPRYSSSKNPSRAYTLLHNTYLFHSSRISRMTAEDIWKFQPEFQKYPLIDFKKYNRNMKILVSKKVRLQQQKMLSIWRICNVIHKNKLLVEVHHSRVNIQLKRCLIKILKMELA